MADYFETIYIDSKRVGCDGGSGVTGHPLVYLDVSKEGQVICPYCSRRFVLKDKQHSSAA